MAVFIGHASQMAAGIESSYGTAVPVTDLLTFTSESLDHEWMRLPDNVLKGKGGMEADTRTNKLVEGGFELDAVYDVIAGANCGCELPIFAVLGNANYTGGRTQYTPIDKLTTFITLGIDKQVLFHEFLSLKLSSLDIAVTPDEVVKLSFGGGVAHDIYKTGDGNITNSSFGLTPTAEATKVVFNSSATFRIGATDDALTSGDAKGISGLNVSFNRGLTGPEFVTASGKTIQPVEDDRRVCTLSFDLPRFETTTYLDWLDSDTELQADMKFTSGSFEFNIYLPTIKIIDAPDPVDGPGAIRQTVTANCFRQSATNTFMKFADAATLITEEIGIECKSNRSAAPS